MIRFHSVFFPALGKNVDGELRQNFYFERRKKNPLIPYAHRKAENKFKRVIFFPSRIE